MLSKTELNVYLSKVKIMQNNILNKNPIVIYLVTPSVNDRVTYTFI